MAADYVRGRELLEQLESCSGKSLWSIEVGLLIEEHSKGLEANKREAKRIRATIPFDLTRAIVDLFSLKCELALSESNYETEFTRTTARLSNKDQDGLFATYFRFKLNRFRFRDFVNNQFEYTSEQLAFVLRLDGTYNILDQYLALVKVLQIACLQNLDVAKSGQIAEIVEKLIAVIPDRRLIGLLHTSMPNSKLQSWHYSVELNEAIELYTLGKYSEAIESASNVIKDDPGNIAAYELLVQAESLEKQGWVDTSKNNSLSAEILSEMGRVVNRKNDSAAAVSRLRRVGTMLDAFSCGPQLHGIAIKLVHVADNRADRYLSVCASTVTPRLAYGVHNGSLADQLLRKLADVLGPKVTIELFRCIGKSAPLTPELVSQLPPERRLKYESNIAATQKNLPTAIALLEQLRGHFATQRPIQAYCIHRLIRLHLLYNGLDVATELIVDAALTDAELLHGISLSEALAIHERRGWRQAKLGLTTIIFYYMTHSSAPWIQRRGMLFGFYLAYLKQAKVPKPSDLDLPADAQIRSRLSYFLRYVCVKEVMDSAYLVFESSKDLDAERIKICQMLISLDSANQSAYSEEITYIVTSRAVEEMITKVGQAKIYVDTDSLFRSLGDHVREKYARHHQILQLNSEFRTALQVSGKLHGKDIEVIIIDDIAPTLLRELFEDIKSKFVSSSEYGLDTYLSARIRHGTLSGEIRSQLEHLHLITRKPHENAEYEANPYWYHLYENRAVCDTKPLDASFQLFSRDIDSIIAVANDEWIQIRNDTDRKSGLFNYDFTDDEFATLANKLLEAPDFETFLVECIESLWDRTYKNLQNIQAIVRGEMNTQISDAINRLEERILIASSHLHGSDLTATITNARTRMQNQLISIAGWFRVVDVSDIEDFNLNQAIQTSLVIIEKTFPHKQLSVATDFHIEEKCSGKSLYPFMDIMHILLHNIVIYSNSSDSKVNLVCRYQHGTLELSVTNRVPFDCNLPSLREKLIAIRANFLANTSSIAVRLEKGSGYPKLARTLRHDLRATSVQLDLSVSNDFEFRVNLKANLTGGM